MTHAISDFGADEKGTERLYRSWQDDSRRILSQAPFGVFQCSGDRVISANLALAEMLGWDSVNAMLADVAFASDFLSRCDGGIGHEGKPNGARRVELHRKDGSVLKVDLVLRSLPSAGGASSFQAGFVRDSTERDALEEKLREAEELAMRGQLAGGIAHDFNNILAGTLINLGLLLQDSSLPVAALDGLRAMQEEMERAAELTRQMLSFSRRNAVALLEPVELSTLMAKLLPLLRRLARENILVVFLPAKEECWISGDAGLIEMLAMHLCLLARRGMPQGGTLTVATYFVSETGDAEAKQVCLTATQARPVPQRTANKTGPLLAAWSQKREEPGWRAIREIVALHHGVLKEPSPVAPNSPCQILFPRAQQPAKSEVEDEGGEVKGGNETVLLIEDERYLRRTSSLCLRKLGYAVLEAGDDEEALKLWEKHREKIDLVFADFLLPGLNTGLELARRMEKEKPNLKIMVASGQGADFEEAIEAAGTGVVHIAKPYNTGELAKALRRCLDQFRPLGPESGLSYK